MRTRTCDNALDVIVGVHAAHPSIHHAIQANTVVFALEGGVNYTEPVKVKDEFMNERWARECLAGFTEISLELFLDAPVSCAGTVLGWGPAMLEYFRAMVQLALKPDYVTCNDQCLHNILLHGPHLRSKFKAIALSALHGPIVTVSPTSRIEVDRYGVVKLRRGKRTRRPVYLHQFDRVPQLWEAVRLAYAALPQNYTYAQ